MLVNFALLLMQYTLEDFVVKFRFHDLLVCLLYVNILTFVIYVTFNTTRTVVFVRLVLLLS